MPVERPAISRRVGRTSLPHRAAQEVILGCRAGPPSCRQAPRSVRTDRSGGCLRTGPRPLCRWDRPRCSAAARGCLGRGTGSAPGRRPAPRNPPNGPPRGGPRREPNGNGRKRFRGSAGLLSVPLGQVVDDRADERPLPAVAVPGLQRDVGRRYAGGRERGPVDRVRVGERPNDGDSVEQPGRLREDLADPDAGDACRDAPQLAADLGRGVRLWVPRLELAGRAPQVEEDAPLRRPNPPAGAVAAVDASFARAHPASVRPNGPRAPTCRRSRRLRPSQNRLLVPRTRSIGYCRGEHCRPQV